MITRNLPSIFFIISAVFLLGLSSCTSDSEKRLPPEAPKVRVREPQSLDRQMLLSVSGALEAASTVHLAFQVGGQVAEVFVQEGQTVKKGQRIGRLDAVKLENSLIIAEAKLTEVSRKHERLAVLYKRGSLTLSDMDKVDAALAESLASANILRQRVGETLLVSPLDGVVAGKRMDPGTVVAPGQAVVDVVQIDQVVAALSIPEADAVHVRVGQKVVVRVPALQDKEFNGTLDELLPVADALTRSYTAKVYLKNDDGMLRPGSIALAAIELDEQQRILTIPGDAVLRTPEGSQYIYVLAEDHSSVRRKQITADGLYRDEVIVSYGLEKDDLVVTGGQNRLSDGTVIRIEQGSDLL